MRSTVSILLVILLVLTSIPHAFCACGCSPIGRVGGKKQVQQPKSGCPHCRQHGSSADTDDSQPSPPKPCKCGSCEAKLALTRATTSTDQMDSRGIWHALAETTVSLPAVVADPCRPSAESAAFTSPALPVRALPILLGHLLF